jgi:cell division protein FtsB
VFFRRLLISLFLLLFVAAGVVAATFFMQTRSEYLRMREIEQLARERLEITRQRLEEQETTLERLRNDPAYVEMVIRRRLGYARPDELIYRFEP